MHISTVWVAALAAAAPLASADERPRIYFPRHVVRKFVNATITANDPHPPPAPTPFAGTAPPTTKRQTSLSDFLPGFPDSFSHSSGSSSSASEASSDDGVTTIVVPSTVYVSPSTETPTAEKPTSPTGSTGTTDGGSSSGTIPDTVVQPTTSPDLPSSQGSTEAVNSSSPATTSSSFSGILLAPTGPVSSSKTPDGLAPISSLLSSVVSQVTSLLNPSPNATETPVVTVTPTVLPTATGSGTGTGVIQTTPPVVTDPIISISLSIPIVPTSVPNVTVTPDPPVSHPSGTGSGSGSGSTVVTVPPSSEPPTSLPPTNVPTSVPTDLPPVTNTTVTPTTPPPTTVPPTSLPPTPTDLPPNTNITSTNTTLPGPPTESPSQPMTSLPPTNTISNTQSWLPTTILVQPTISSPNPTGLAPTSGSGLPTGLPRAITPDSNNAPLPEDTMEIQLAFNFGLNWRFVAVTPKAAAQMLKTVPDLLAYQGGFDPSKSVVRRLVPLDTEQPLGFTTTLAIVTYPIPLVDRLRMDMHIPTAPLWNNPNQLAYNMSLEINSAIDILVGSTLEYTPTGSLGPGATSTSNPNDVFNNDNGSDQSPQQRGVTAGIAVGAVAVSAAYGMAMFVIARRYKKKKQAHRRSSSLSSPSEMRQSGGSPALMGGALLSRDFTSSYGGVAGGRDSHGSGRSNMNNSGRTAYISAPVAAENSLGWN